MLGVSVRFLSWDRKALGLVLRVAAWVALVGVTGALLRAEVRQSDVPSGVNLVKDVVYRADRRLRLDVYRPDRPAPAGGWPAAIAIHGGGWRGGNKDGYGRMAARLVKHGFVVVSVDYTLARPGSPSWPENLEDVRAAVRWVRAHASELGVDTRRFVALGASAGGHLAALVGTDPEDDSARVSAVVDFYGPSDLRALAESQRTSARAIEVFLGGSPRAFPDRYAAASPALRVTDRTPPMLLIHGAQDKSVPVAQSTTLSDALAARGIRHRVIVVDDARHGFDFRLDARRDLLPDVLTFLSDVWKGDGNAEPR
jgi:acetyl esterase/lipase